MKVQSDKIADVRMDGSSGNRECAGGDASAGLGKRKRKRIVMVFVVLSIGNQT